MADTWKTDIITELTQLKNELRDKLNKCYTTPITEISVPPAYNVDYSKGKVFKLTMTADTTFNFVKPPSGTNVVIELIIDGNFVPTFTGATMLNGSAPFDGTKTNHITLSINNYTSGTDDILYTIQWI